MKRNIVLLTLSVLLFSSCIVKSIQPFYSNNTINFDKRLVGNWTTGKTSSWNIESFKDKWEKETDPKTEISEFDKKIFENYKNGYYINYIKNETEASFIAMPFMVDEHLFLDFIPFETNSDDLNKLAGQHLLKTHSATFVEFQKNGSVKLKWLSQSTMNKLIEKNKVRIKYETVGFDEDYVLTAKSEELHKFLKKFMSSDIENKWDNDVIKTLTPTNAKP